ncbi:MAG: sugar O-acetyltransferase, partial [Clostridia bacterium]|nr:sugar O-acetyltransferase [Clostridia bacterium]
MMEKLHSGEIYNPNDPKVMIEQTRRLTRLYRFNKTRPYQYPKRMRMLK